MFAGRWRDDAWSRLGEPWDIIVVGGGITGAGVAREAARLELRTLLVEARDFASGTSSRSSRLIHGGVRYLRQGRLRLVRDAVRERERLVREAPGLVEPLGFLFPERRGDRPGKGLNRAALAVYDLLAGRRTSRFFPADRFLELAPRLDPAGLLGGHSYREALTDDARLTLRVLGEAVGYGAVALNYVAVEGLLQWDGRVTGVRLRDAGTGRVADAHGRAIVNATGPWSDRLAGEAGAPVRLRPLRGSHLVFPGWRLPVAQALGFPHPLDRRPVSVVPWEGVTVVGTTDVDHGGPLDGEVAITPAEVAYLLAAVGARFPTLGLGLDDIISTWSGVRPVIDGGDDDSSRAAREHAIWEDRGLITVVGGKLTTFRLMAQDALMAVAAAHPELAAAATPAGDRALDAAPLTLNGGVAAGLGEEARRRLTGRYGAGVVALLAAARPGELEAVPGTPYRWLELRWAARAEGVVHLDDLLLRRLRLGLLLPDGGAALLPRIRALCQDELGWDDARWADEEARYRTLWRAAYSLPDRRAIPDWRATPAGEGSRTAVARGVARRRVAVGVLAGMGVLRVGWALRRRLLRGREAGALVRHRRSGAI